VDRPVAECLEDLAAVEHLAQLVIGRPVERQPDGAGAIAV
jgi:hypothetical protein